jgi:formylglycine-generating enzyme required for sulfatase activity/stress response protein SCP2
MKTVLTWNNPNIHLHLVTFLLDNDNKVQNAKDFVGSKNVQSACGSVQWTGQQNGQTVTLNTVTLPDYVQRVVFSVSTANGLTFAANGESSVFFGDGNEKFTCALSEDDCPNDALCIFGEVRRKENNWTWQALFEEKPDASLKDLAEQYCIKNPVLPTLVNFGTDVSKRNAGNRIVLKIKKVDFVFRWCPSEMFTMGDENIEDAKPRNVRLTKGFWIAETQTRQEQWKAVMGSNPSYFKGAKLPVEQISWNDCQVFIEKLNVLLTTASNTNKGGTDNALTSAVGYFFALPTEAEWEYACRAGSTTAFCFGESDRSLGGYAWYRVNSDEMTHPVGTKKANAWGLYDMHGNVWEWCQDWYGNYSDDVIDPVGDLTGAFHVNRGGGWNGSARDCWSADRSGDAPGDRSNNLGFRLSLVQSSQ